MSPSPSILSKPTGDARLSPLVLGYVQSATRLELHQLVLKAFAESGISQSTLAKRLGKRPEQVSRLLGAPGNWTIDTFAHLLFAIDGSLARVEGRDPAGKRGSNHTNGWHPTQGSAATAGSNVPGAIGAAVTSAGANPTLLVREGA